VVVGRDWKTHVATVLALYNQDPSAVTADLQSIVLKIMVIPAA
jgi:hypothetical protein